LVHIEASKQRAKDYTSGNLTRNIWDLSWPSVVSMSLFSIPNILDGMWIGRLGANALAAVGIGMALRITMISPLMALSGASGAIVARYVGAKDQERANLAVLQAVMLFAVTAGAIGLIGLAFIEPLLRLAGATGEILPLAASYVRIIFIGLIAMEMVPSAGSMFVAAGSPELSLRVNLLVAFVTMASEPILVLGLGAFSGWGIAGAALALVLGNSCGMLYALFLLLTRQAPVWIDVHRLQLDWAMIARIVRIALPAVIQRGTPNLAQSILIRLISAYGAAPLATYNVVMRVIHFALIPSMGTSRSAGALVGQNLGARQPERAGRAAMSIVAIASTLAICLIGIATLSGRTVLYLFTADAEVIAQGVHIMSIIGLGQVFFMASLTFDNSLTGAGDTLSPMVINTFVLWAIQLPLTYLLSRGLGWRSEGIWWAIVISQVCLATLMTLRFRQGHWKLKEI